jgi:hypothetical protein
MYELTYAERLRGRRFWAPVLGLVAATVLGTALQQNANRTATARSVAAPVLAAGNLDPSLRGVITALGAHRLFCTDPSVMSAHEVSCGIGSTANRVTFRSYATHRAELQAMTGIERSTAGAASASYLVNGGRWIATGTWSSAGDYNDSTSVQATVAQQISKQLSGCLELLPREHGSCRY